MLMNNICDGSPSIEETVKSTRSKDKTTHGYMYTLNESTKQFKFLACESVVRVKHE